MLPTDARFTLNRPWAVVRSQGQAHMHSTSSGRPRTSPGHSLQRLSSSLRGGRRAGRPRAPRRVTGRLRFTRTSDLRGLLFCTQRRRRHEKVKLTEGQEQMQNPQHQTTWPKPQASSSTLKATERHVYGKSSTSHCCGSSVILWGATHGVKDTGTPF